MDRAQGKNMVRAALSITVFWKKPFLQVSSHVHWLYTSENMQNNKLPGTKISQCFYTSTGNCISYTLVSSRLENQCRNSVTVEVGKKNAGTGISNVSMQPESRSEV